MSLVKGFQLPQSVIYRGISWKQLSSLPNFSNTLYNVPVMKKTYLVFITSESQLFEWNIQSLGDTKMHQTWR